MAQDQSDLSDSQKFPFAAFHFQPWQADDAAGLVYLPYAFENGPQFREVIDFGAALPAPGSPLRAGFEAAVDALHLAAGISYYKAYLPPRMVRDAGGLSPARRDFFQCLYENGLGEFAARNAIAVWDRVNFPADTVPDAVATPVILPRRTAVLIGGGKDSLVSLEALRAAAEPLVLFAVNPKKPILDCAAASGLPLITVKRSIDAGLFALNDAGALNGHIPITAIVSLTALAAAFVHGYDAVVLSNERSANEGNTVFAGRMVNHQYSKSLPFEQMLAAYVTQHIAPGLQYFSLLRPLSEFHIARLFARVDRYDTVFTSCNRAFVLRATTMPKRWCCECPKCRFAFLILATAMTPARLTAIFGQNLLEDGGAISAYEELTGLAGHKPWECVGEIAESSAALLRLAETPGWQSCAVVQALAPRLKAHVGDYHAVEAALLTPAPDHLLPERYEGILRAYLG